MDQAPSLRDTLDVCIDPLEYVSHPDGALMNIATGQIAHTDVDADNEVSLGHRAMENVEGGWPVSLYCPLVKLVVTMDVKKNHVLVGKERVYDQELIYASFSGLLASSREINFNDVLVFELVAHPPSVFSADGNMNVATSKSTRKHKLQVTIYERNCPISDTMIYDVSALIWVITWPSGKLRVYVDAFKAFVHQAIRRANIILVFSRYFPNSIKKFTRTQRSGSSRVCTLTPDMHAPTKNKIQLNAMLTEGILDPGYFPKQQRRTPLPLPVSG